MFAQHTTSPSVRAKPSDRWPPQRLRVRLRDMVLDRSSEMRLPASPVASRQLTVPRPGPPSQHDTPLIMVHILAPRHTATNGRTHAKLAMGPPCPWTGIRIWPWAHDALQSLASRSLGQHPIQYHYCLLDALLACAPRRQKRTVNANANARANRRGRRTHTAHGRRRPRDEDKDVT